MSASRSQSASTPLNAPMRRASAATPERQSTVVPKTSKVRARTPLTSGLSTGKDAVIFREVALDHRQLKCCKDRARLLAFQKEVEAPRDEVLYILGLSATCPVRKVGRPDHHHVMRPLAGLVDA